MIRALPKAELHVHLEGTVDGPALEAMGLRRGRGDALDPRFRGTGLPAFLRHFKEILDVLRPADYGLLAGRYLRRAAAQGVRHVELYLSLASAMRRGHPVRPLLESIRAAIDSVPGVTAAILIDCVRQFGPEDAGKALDEALRHGDLGLVAGFGMGGDEGSIPARAFSRVFTRARAAGLGIVVHAGEAGGPESVADVLEALDPHRIAHGIGASASPRLLERLADAGVPLDVCITSNVATGAVARLEDHPLCRLVRAGVRVTLGTDDPGLFGIDLVGEYRRGLDLLGGDGSALRRLAATSLEAALPIPG